MNLIFGNFVVGTSVINRFCQLDSFDRYGFQGSSSKTPVPKPN